MKLFLVAFLLVDWMALSALGQDEATTTATPTISTEATTTAKSDDVTTASNTQTTQPAAVPTTTQPATVKPVSSDCKKKYSDCEAKNVPVTTSTCEDFTQSKTCINSTQSNEVCTDGEQRILEFLECGPANFFNSTVRSPCADRISQCLWEAGSFTGIDTGAIDFKTFFCKEVAGKPCLTQTSGEAKCTNEENTAILKKATCSAPQTLFSSVLVIAIAFMLQRSLKGC